MFSINCLAIPEIYSDTGSDTDTEHVHNTCPLKPTIKPLPINTNFKLPISYLNKDELFAW